MLVGGPPLRGRLWRVEVSRCAPFLIEGIECSERLVAPGGDAKEHLVALTRHLEQHAPWGAQVTVTPGDLGQPYAIDASGPVYDAARAAFRQAWGNEPVDTGVGGSIPFIAEFADAFPSAKILVTGVEDPQTQAHSINESLHLGVLERAATAEALLLANLGSNGQVAP